MLNVLNVARALKEIKIKQLDDEFQQAIIGVINPLFPVNINISSETSGDELIRLLDNDVPRELRMTIIAAIVFDNDDIRRFYTDVERCQRDNVRNVEFDDNVKGNFILNNAFLVIVVVSVMMVIYVKSSVVRGNLPPSNSLPVIALIVKALSTDVTVVEKHIEKDLGEETP